MIAKTAVIRGQVDIGENVEIGEYCVIDGKVSIGDNCKLKNNVVITGNTTIGSNNRFYSFAVVGSEPQDLKYAGEDTRLVLGDDNIVREFTTINPGTKDGGGITSLGNGNLVMVSSHIGHDCIIGSHCIIANCGTLGGHVRLGDYVNIGGLTAVHQFVQIGDGVMIGGVSGLGQDVPPYTLAQGRPARVSGLNIVRLRRLFSKEVVNEIVGAYKEIFAAGNTTECAKRLKEEHKGSVGYAEIEKICDFILGNTRGLAFRAGDMHGKL